MSGKAVLGFSLLKIAESKFQQFYEITPKEFRRDFGGPSMARARSLPSRLLRQAAISLSVKAVPGFSLLKIAGSKFQQFYEITPEGFRRDFGGPSMARLRAPA